MFTSLFRIISNLFTPGFDMMARMPASAARQILFPLSGRWKPRLTTVNFRGLIHIKARRRQRTDGHRSAGGQPVVTLPNATETTS